MKSFFDRYFTKIALVFILATYFFFGLQHIGKFITADEHYWVYERIPQYWNAVAEGKWKKTFINDKPGVSLALVSGIGLFFEPHPETLCSENKEKIMTCQTDRIEKVLFLFRLPILIINGFILLYLFWIIGILTNPWIALWTITLAAFSPILLGISQIVNPDSLLWSFGAAAIFSFFALLLKSKKKNFLLLTIIFTGLALLSKYTAIILLPFYLAFIILHFLYADETTPETSRIFLRKSIVQWVIIIFGSLVFLCFFLPALLVSPSARDAFLIAIPNKLIFFSSGGLFFVLLVIDTTILKNKILFFIRAFFQKFFVSFFYTLPIIFFGILIFLIIVRNFFTEWKIFTIIPFDIKELPNARYYADIPNFFEALLLEWNPLVFSLTPIALIGIISLLITLIRKKTTEKHILFIYSLLFFILTYFILLIFSNVLATPRYIILLYPIFAFIAALGIWYITEKISLAYTKVAVTLIIFFASLASLSVINPFYFNYTNFLLPKSALISDAWGYGGYEAAQYLNNLPEANNLTVWTDYYGVCEFFAGKCLMAYSFNKETIQPDYYVLTRRGQIRYISRYLRWEEKSGLTAYKYYDISNSDWQLFIGDRQKNFVKVVKVNNK